MKKKGFTLIELMIVLAIIAILAVVLIPKSQIFKNNSKNAGVITNVNTVRAYLETKVTNSGGANSYQSSSVLTTTLQNTFNLDTDSEPATGSVTSDEQLINPFDKDQASIKVVDTDISGSLKSYIGEVIVVANGSSYEVYGVDNGGNKTQVFKIK